MRRQRGLGTVELAISCFALTIMTLLAVDLGVLMLGNQVLDRAARDATRAAAGQSSLPSAINAAKAALAMHKTDGYFVGQPSLTNTVAPDFVYQDYAGTPPGQTIPAGNPGAGTRAGNPFVTVTTRVQVRLPASLCIFGCKLEGQDLINGDMKFLRTYTFPIVRQSLNKSFS